MVFFGPAEGGPGVLFREKKDKGIIQRHMKIICGPDPQHQNRQLSYFSFSSRDARVKFLQKIVFRGIKNGDFGTFFNSSPVVHSNAAPDSADTTYPGQAPDAHYARPGHAGLRRTVQKISN